MYKYTQPQNDNIKNIKKPKEIKLLTNYIPVKKTHFQSNISEYETEPSIQKNFSNKCQKNKQITQAKSVQTTHKNQFSPKKFFAQKSKRNYSNASQSSKGSLYNWNNLNIYDYFSEKVILTQKKFIDYKNNKINTLKKELSLIMQEINLHEKKIMPTNNNNNSKNKNIANSSKNSSTDKNMNKSQIAPKILYINKNNNKYLLVNNNNSYLSLNGFYNHEINNNGENADKKLEKHLSHLLTENNSDNNLKYRTNNSNPIINDNKKKQLLSVMYQSKKGCYNCNNNNYEHNIKNILKSNIINNMKNNKDIPKKNKNMDKDIKHNLYFYTNKMRDKQIQIKDNKNNKKPDNDSNLELDLKYKTLDQKINKIFNSFFDYYEKNNNKI